MTDRLASYIILLWPLSCCRLDSIFTISGELRISLYGSCYKTVTSVLSLNRLKTQRIFSDIAASTVSVSLPNWIFLDSLPLHTGEQVVKELFFTRCVFLNSLQNSTPQLGHLRWHHFLPCSKPCSFRWSKTSKTSRFSICCPFYRDLYGGQLQ